MKKNKIIAFSSLYLIVMMSCTAKIPLPIHNNDISLIDLSPKYLVNKSQKIYDFKRNDSLKILNPNAILIGCSSNMVLGIKSINFDKNDNGLIRIGNYLINFNKDGYLQNFKKLEYGFISNYSINDEFNGYVLYEINTESERYKAVDKVINNEVTNTNVLDVLIGKNNLGNLFTDIDENIFYVVLENGRMLIFEDMNLIKEINFIGEELNYKNNIKPFINIDKSKSGLIIYQLASASVYFKRMSELNILDVYKEVYDFNLKILDSKIDSNGNGILFYSAANNIFSKKITNYRTDRFDLKQDLIDDKNEAKKLFTMNINSLGVGYIAWTDKLENVYIKPINNFSLSDKITKLETTQNIKTSLSLGLDSKKNITIAWNEEIPPYCDELVIKKVEAISD